MWNPCGILWNPYGICGIHMEYYGIHVEYVESIWIPWKELWWIPSHSTWIPEEYSMVFPYGMNMETYAKMAGPSAKQIPYGIHGIHMELAWIPPGIRLECGGTVKTLSVSRRNIKKRQAHLVRPAVCFFCVPCPALDVPP